MALYSPVRDIDKYDRYKVAKLSEELGITEIGAILLKNRGVTDVAAAQSYMNPRIEDLKDPFGLLDMDRAVARINIAVANGQRITIYGDYDVDGVTASAILYLYLRELGANVDVYIPHRYDEGYGLNTDAIQTLSRQGTELLITVDCGISAFEEAEEARSLGIDLIITDHHNVDLELPYALAIVNPKRAENLYRDELAGVGVAAKLVHALGGLNALEEYIDLVAIGTIADMVPLIGENRILTAIGLDKINRSPRLGIEALAHVAGLEGTTMTSQNIAFGIGPRLNAAGRMDSAMDAFKLLVTEDPADAAALASKLDRVNKTRQDIEAGILEQAKGLIDPDITGRDRIIILEHNDWHAGIIGIAASKLVEQYRRPVILLTHIGSDIYTGSARSIEGFSIYDAIYSTRSILESFGGHEQAAGLRIEREHIETLKYNLESYSRERITRDMLIPRYSYDLKLYNKDITMDLYNDLERLEPFGMANPTPMFLLEGAYIDSLNLVGKRQDHAKLSIGMGERLWEGIWFNGGESKNSLDTKPYTDILVGLEKNEWNGLTKLQFNVKSLKMRTQNIEDLKKFLDIFYFKFFDDFYHNFLYNRESTHVPQSNLENISLSGTMDKDGMLEMLKSCDEGNLIMISDKNITGHILSELMGEELLGTIEIGYRDLISKNGRGLDGLVILPKIPLSRLNEYENIFIMSGDRFIHWSALEEFKGQLWLVEHNHGSSLTEDLHLTRENFVSLYTWLKRVAKRQRFWNDIDTVIQEYNRTVKEKLNYFQFRVVIEVFKELDFVKCNITDGHVIAKINNRPKNRGLEESHLYGFYTAWSSRHKLGMDSHEFKEVN